MTEALRDSIGAEGAMADRVQARTISNEEGNRLLRIVRRGTGSVVTWRRAQAMDVPNRSGDSGGRLGASAWSVVATVDKSPQDAIGPWRPAGFATVRGRRRIALVRYPAGRRPRPLLRKGGSRSAPSGRLGRPRAPPAGGLGERSARAGRPLGPGALHGQAHGHPVVFKRFRRRVFLMTRVHHHFEMS